MRLAESRAAQGIIRDVIIVRLWIRVEDIWPGAATNRPYSCAEPETAEPEPESDPGNAALGMQGWSLRSRGATNLSSICPQKST